MRTLLLLSVVAACHGNPVTPDPAGPDAPVAPGVDGSATGCAPGLAGAPCVLALYDRTLADCTQLPALRTELDARAGLGPLWADGRALFRTPLAVAGGFNGWSTTALVGAPVCGSDVVVAVGPVATGRWPYKLVAGATWQLDATNPAFAYDDFTGNADHKNSVIDTPDSGLGHIVSFGEECSTTLNDCREVTAYLPAGYDAPAQAGRTYPVLFMHDGQNLWDDHSCCFGHTGWELNVLLDGEIAAGKVAPIIVIGAASTVGRNNQYGLDAAQTEAFIKFQVEQLQPHALAHVRGAPNQRLYIAGSSLGGLMAMELALRYPSIYAGAASLSGAFWPGMDTHTALRDQLPGYGKQAVAIYLDHGGNPTDNSDGAADTIEVRDMMIGEGWQRSDSPTCTPGPSALCYHAEPGATHDELAWKARAWRFVEFLFPGS